MNRKTKFHKPNGPAFYPGERWFAVSSPDSLMWSVEIVSIRRWGDFTWDVDVTYKNAVGDVFKKCAWDFQIRYFHQADRNITRAHSI